MLLDILKFDNSYSWARSKEVFYSVKLLAPTVMPHPHPQPLPVLHVEIQRQTEAESQQWTLSSSEDEFFDCVQELEIVQQPVTVSSSNYCLKQTEPRSQILTGTSRSTQV